jgi:hypothetical protein
MRNLRGRSDRACRSLPKQCGFQLSNRQASRATSRRPPNQRQSFFVWACAPTLELTAAFVLVGSNWISDRQHDLAYAQVRFHTTMRLRRFRQGQHAIDSSGLFCDYAHDLRRRHFGSKLAGQRRTRAGSVGSDLSDWSVVGRQSTNAEDTRTASSSSQSEESGRMAMSAPKHPVAVTRADLEGECLKEVRMWPSCETVSAVGGLGNLRGNFTVHVIDYGLARKKVAGQVVRPIQREKVRRYHLKAD